MASPRAPQQAIQARDAAPQFRGSQRDGIARVHQFVSTSVIGAEFFAHCERPAGEAWAYIKRHGVPHIYIGRSMRVRRGAIQEQIDRDTEAARRKVTAHVA